MWFAWLYVNVISYFSDMFHPDNIKNYHSNGGGKVSVSVYNYWKKIGGPKGLANALKSDLKVSYQLKDCVLIILQKGITGSESDIRNRKAQ